MKKVIRILAVFCALFGLITLGWIFYPVVSYQINAPKVMTFLSPIAKGAHESNVTDYTKASSWFPDASKLASAKTNGPSYYKISIPRLGIKEATVAIGGEDLSTSLIQYPGTSLPGRNGNTVVFGHSVLPTFYDPTDYLTIFSTLPSLGTGDIVSVNYDGITYKYEVERKFEVQPTDVEILNQNYSDSFLSLVTCVPPGLVTRRLVVVARIVPVKSS